MLRPKLTMVVILAVDLVAIAPFVSAQETEQSERETMYHRYQNFWSYVEGGVVEPHWLADGSTFWYVEGAPENTEIYKVDPNADTVDPLFDVKKVRSLVVARIGHEPSGKGLPFTDFRFVDKAESVVEFEVEEQEYRLDLASYALAPMRDSSGQDTEDQPKESDKELSPDGGWTVSKSQHNLWLRSVTDDRKAQLTQDGEEYLNWEVESWSPNSRYLILSKHDTRAAHRSPYVTWLKPEHEVKWRFTPKVGTELKVEIYVVDARTAELKRVDVGDEPSQQLEFLGWTDDGAELLLGRVSRWYKTLEVLAATPATGSVRRIVIDTSNTFLATPFPKIPNWRKLFTPVQDGERFIWASERDGWRHLYLYQLDGTLVRRLTKGRWPVSLSWEVEVAAGWVYFRGRSDPERPYDLHYMRVRLDGTGLSQLTQASGYHDIVLSPSKKFFLDTHSSIDRLPTVELRRSNGTLVRVLTRGRLRKPEELSWTAPEEFVVKAADGESDLYGVLFKPWDFDAARSYPVVEAIYNGPQTPYVARSIGSAGWTNAEAYHAQALAQLGFVVVMVDGRGTPERGKAFQDVVYRKFGRFEVDDHSAVLRQLRTKRPYMDLSRVGIYGGSWGGYFTTRALLLAPELYKVGVAAVPAHPTGWIHEPYLGPPEENENLYAYAKNETHVDRLRGKLLFITGTSDFWYPDLMKLLEAFVLAGKPYDLVVFPDRFHNLGYVPGDPATDYYWDALRRYFQEHLRP